jgi:hypothetical protein
MKKNKRYVDVQIPDVRIFDVQMVKKMMRGCAHGLKEIIRFFH